MQSAFARSAINNLLQSQSGVAISKPSSRNIGESKKPPSAKERTNRSSNMLFNRFCPSRVASKPLERFVESQNKPAAGNNRHFGDQFDCMENSQEYPGHSQLSDLSEPSQVSRMDAAGHIANSRVPSGFHRGATNTMMYPMTMRRGTIPPLSSTSNVSHCMSNGTREYSHARETEERLNQSSTVITASSTVTVSHDQVTRQGLTITPKLRPGFGLFPSFAEKMLQNNKRTSACPSVSVGSILRPMHNTVMKSDMFTPKRQNKDTGAEACSRPDTATRVKALVNSELALLGKKLEDQHEMISKELADKERSLREIEASIKMKTDLFYETLETADHLHVERVQSLHEHEGSLRLQCKQFEDKLVIANTVHDNRVTQLASMMKTIEGMANSFTAAAEAAFQKIRETPGPSEIMQLTLPLLKDPIMKVVSAMVHSTQITSARTEFQDPISTPCRQSQDDILTVSPVKPQRREKRKRDPNPRVTRSATKRVKNCAESIKASPKCQSSQLESLRMTEASFVSPSKPLECIEIPLSSGHEDYFLESNLSNRVEMCTSPLSTSQCTSENTVVFPVSQSPDSSPLRPNRSLKLAPRVRRTRSYGRRSWGHAVTVIKDIDSFLT
jgi:hypothetical protein